MHQMKHVSLRRAHPDLHCGPCEDTSVCRFRCFLGPVLVIELTMCRAMPVQRLQHHHIAEDLLIHHARLRYFCWIPALPRESCRALNSHYMDTL